MFLVLNRRPKLTFGIFKEHIAARTRHGLGQRHKSPGPIQQVVMASERRGQKNSVEKKTLVTRENQSGNASVARLGVQEFSQQPSEFLRTLHGRVVPGVGDDAQLTSSDAVVH